MFFPLSGAGEEWADDRVGCPELMTSPVFTSSFTFVLTWRLSAASERELILLRTSQFLKRKTAHLAGNALTEGRAAGHTRTLCLLDLGAEGEWWIRREEGPGGHFTWAIMGWPASRQSLSTGCGLKTPPAAPFSAAPHRICAWPQHPAKQSPPHKKVIILWWIGEEEKALQENVMIIENSSVLSPSGVLR